MNRRTFLFSSLAAVAVQAFPKDLFADDLSILEVAHLLVNNNNAIRTAVEKSEIKGITDLAELVLTATDEESWIYLSKKINSFSEYSFDHKNGLWVEQGLKTARAENMREVIIDDSVLNKVLDSTLKGYGNMLLIDYHFHPLLTENKGLVELVKKNPTELKVNSINKQVIDWYCTDSNITTIIPSANDFTRAISLELLEKPQRFILRYRLASHLGIIDYNFTPQGKTYFKKFIRSIADGNNHYDGQKLAKEVEERLDDDFFPAVVHTFRDKTREWLTNNKRITYTNEHFKVIITPYKRVA